MITVDKHNERAGEVEAILSANFEVIPPEIKLRPV